MSDETPTNDGDQIKPPQVKRSHITQSLLRGIGTSLPPILTIVILIWIARGAYDYIIYPTSTVVRYAIAQFIEETERRDRLVNMRDLPALAYCDRNYRITPALRDSLAERLRKRGEESDQQNDNGNQSRSRSSSEIPVEWIESNLSQVYVPFGRKAVPYPDYEEVARRFNSDEMPATAIGVYMELVTTRYFQSLFHLSAVAIAITLVLLYFIGRFVTARVGAWAVHRFETVFLGRLPLVSNVYSSVKQVTDFFLSERQVEYRRVVAIEYPRRGIWSLGLVTGDSMLEITAAAGEPMISVLIPSSPMPVTGYTMSLPRSEVIDLNMTIDQAFQFCLSCGVLVPPHQKVTPELLQQELTKRLTGITGKGIYPPERTVLEASQQTEDAKSPPASGDSQQTTGSLPETEKDSP